MEKILFIRSPRYRITGMAEYMNFQFPLGMCSIASALCESLPGLVVDFTNGRGYYYLARGGI